MPVQSHPAIATHDAKASFQRYARTFLSVPISLHHLTGAGIGTTRGISLDISEGGLGALVQGGGGLQVGETVGIDFRLCEQPLRTVAIVRYTSSVRSGFEFLGLTAEERQQITSVVGST
jgi:c-di-GMP-binding flagellar brake protein YcgR